MARLRTAASLLGLLTGAWVLWGSFFGPIGRSACGGVCPEPGPPNPFVVGLAVLLMINSGVGLIGPNRVFYVLAALSILLAGALVPTSSLNSLVVEVSLGLSLATFAFSLVAARRVTGFSEQSNPMNLPVFG